MRQLPDFIVGFNLHPCTEIALFHAAGGGRQALHWLQDATG